MTYHRKIEIKGSCEVKDCEYGADCIIFTKRVCDSHFRKIKNKTLKVGNIVWKK